jgi:putative beta-lysine N-acetyltransferase
MMILSPLFLKIPSGWSGEVTDVICRTHGCLLQHGTFNDRIYVMKCGDDLPRIIPFLETLAQENDYGKTVIKVRSDNADPWRGAGFIEEARIPDFFPDDDCLFLAKFHRHDRKREPQRARYEGILQQCRGMEESRDDPALPGGYSLKRCGNEDAMVIAHLYREIFPSYPFPIDDPVHVRKMMEDSSMFYGILSGDRIVAVSSADRDASSASVEMTDFATHPDHRGRKLAGILLHYIEDEVKKAGMRTAFTIARADSLPISIIFARSGYRFGGRLVNNTNICGSLRSMNVWYKHF